MLITRGFGISGGGALRMHAAPAEPVVEEKPKPKPRIVVSAKKEFEEQIMIEVNLSEDRR